MVGNPKIGVFVNVTNLFYGTLAVYRGAKVDWEMYLTKLEKRGTPIRAFAYGVQTEEEEFRTSRFVAFLRTIGFETRYKTVGGHVNGYNKDWNIAMAMEVARMLDRVDMIVVGSNDPDIIPLLQYVKERGVKCVLFAANIPDELRAVADDVIEVDHTCLRQPAEIEACSSK